MQLKVLCLTPWFPPYPESQEGNYIWDSVQALEHQGVQVDVLLTRPWKFSVKPIDLSKFNTSIKLFECNYLSIPRHFLKIISNFLFLRNVMPKLQELTKNNSYDLIHAHTETCGLAAQKAGKFYGIPSCITVHGVDTCHRMWNGRAGKMFYDALSKTDRLIYVGKPLHERFDPYLPRHDHIRIVYNGFRLPDLKKCPSTTFKDYDKWRIISVSNLVEGKGVDINLRALAKLNKSGVQSWCYTVVGDGAERKKLENLACQLGVADKVTFVGACPHDKVYKLLSQADVFSLPSYREAFGIAYLEAMNFGLLTIGVLGQGAEAFIKNNENGILVKAKDVDALASKFKFVFQNLDKAKIFAEAGKATAFESFTWKIHAKNLLEVYYDLCR